MDHAGTEGERPDPDGMPLLLSVSERPPAPDRMADLIDTSLAGVLIDGLGFVVPFRDWATAEECLRLLRQTVKQAMCDQEG